MESPPSQAPNRLKIKPILTQRFASGKNQNPKNLQKKCTTSAKEFKLIKTSNLTRSFICTLTSSQPQLSKLEFDHEYEQPDGRYAPKSFPTTIRCLFSKIKNLRSLTTFNLNIHQVLLSKRRFYLKSLLMSLACLKNLSKVSIVFSTSMTKDLEPLKITFKYLKRIKTLEGLTISFGEFYRASTTNIDIFLLDLSKLRQICSLKLPLCSSFGMSEYFLNKLALTLPKLRFLTTIDIDFNESSDLANHTENLFSSFSKVKALSEITLSLENTWSEYANDPISRGLSLLDPSRIRKLKIHPYHHLGRDCLVEFSQALKNFTSLEIFEIALTEHWVLQEEGIETLASTLSSLISLKSLTVILCLKPEDKGVVENLAAALKFLTNLVSLKLQFEGSAFFQGKGIELLFSNLKRLKSLKFLTLNCPLPEINDQNLETLGKSLKELPQLQSLSLDFSFAKLVTICGVEALANGVKMLTSLTCFTLWLEGNKNLENTTIDYIVDAIQDLPDLYSVDFNFLSCFKITCFDELFQALKQAKNIGEIALALSGDAMNSQVISHLRESKIVKRIGVL